jgi:predicted nucleic acid-binding Zn ribbon protein
MAIENTPKTCLSCDKPINGRADKKFCDDNCRNVYNNQLNSDSNNFVRNVINTLRKNRRILEELIPSNESMVRTSLDKMLQKGYQTQYHTHTYTNKKGDVYHFCFEYGYLKLEGNGALVVKRE